MSDDKKAKKDEKSEEDKSSKDAAKGGDGAEGGAEGAEGAAPASKFTPKKIVLFVVLPLLLIIGGGAAAYFMGFLDKVIPGKHLSCENVKEGDKDFAACNALKEEKDNTAPGVFLEVPSVIVNLSSLNSSSKQPRFLKISLKIELENEEEKKKFEPIMPRAIDQFQMYLRELRIEDLRGTSGIYRMKIELLSRVRAAAPNIKVRDILFQEILVQ